MFSCFCYEFIYIYNDKYVFIFRQKPMWETCSDENYNFGFLNIGCIFKICCITTYLCLINQQILYKCYTIHYLISSLLTTEQYTIMVTTIWKIFLYELIPRARDFNASLLSLFRCMTSSKMEKLSTILRAILELVLVF